MVVGLLSISPPLVVQLTPDAASWMPTSLAWAISGVAVDPTVPMAVLAVGLGALITVLAGLVSTERRDEVCVVMTSSGRSGPREGRPVAVRLVLAYGAFVVAVIVAAVGTGLALPHLSKGGLSLVAWFGLALLVGGLLATGWAAISALSGVRRRWWVLVLPLLLVTAYVAMWTVGQGVAASFPARPELGERTPASLGLAYTDVTLRTSDNVDLAAWWVPPTNGAAVALLHGAGSTRTAVLDHAATLAEGGYGVLLVDARGHGESDGRGMDLGWYGERDAEAAVDFLASRPGVAEDRIALVGLSMGGESAIGAAGADPRVRAVVADGATNRVAADKAFLDAYGTRGELQQGIDRLTYGVAGLLTGAPEPPSLRDSIRASAQHSAPTLLIAAGDVETEQLAADHLEAAAPGAVQTWTVPRSGHTQGLRSAPEAWQRQVLGFLDTALAGESGGDADLAAVTTTTDVEQVFTEQLEAAGVPGGAFVTVTADGDVDARAVGTTGEGVPVTPRTPFVIGSTTKSFTALALMQLVEAGKVDLDAPVVRYVPDFTLAPAEPVADITVRHLLQQTSGLDDLSGGPILASATEGTALEAVAELSDARLASAPGETWRYANVNYVLAGLVIAAASGQTYPDYLQQHVLDVLEMDDTFVVADPAVAPGHRYWFGLAASSGPVQREGVVAAGYLASTAEDLGSYLGMYLREGMAPDGTRVLSPAGVRALTAPGPESHLGSWADGSDARYAMGWMVGGPWAEPAVFHPGNSPDSSAMIALFPDRGVAAATLVPAGHEVPVPGNPSLTDRIARNTMHSVLGEPVPPPTSRWGFYVWFDAAVGVAVALAFWSLWRATRAGRRPAPGRVRRWLLPLPSLLTALLLLALPILTSGGWRGVWTWAPDLATTLLVLSALAAAVAVVRIGAAIRGGRGQPDAVKGESAAERLPTR